MGFVKSTEELARIRETLVNARFTNFEVLSVSFLTDPATVARLLPPPLEPTDRPVVTVDVSRYSSNCVGDYNSSTISLAARYQDIEAGYFLAFVIDSDAGLIYGRELEGSPKKLGRAGIVRQGSKMFGWAERHGVRLVEIQADLTTDLGPSNSKNLQIFCFKALQASNGDGLEDDAYLTVGGAQLNLAVELEGQGSITLGGSDLDPWNEIEVKEVLGSSYMQGDLEPRFKTIGRIPAADILPYYYGRADDWSLLNTADKLQYKK